MAWFIHPPLVDKKPPIIIMFLLPLYPIESLVTIVYYLILRYFIVTLIVIKRHRTDNN